MTEDRFSIIKYFKVKNIIFLIAQNEGIEYFEALELFYSSTTYEILSDEKSKLWWLSSEALYEDYMSRKAGEL